MKSKKVKPAELAKHADALVAELFAQRGDHPQPAQLMTWKLPPA